MLKKMMKLSSVSALLLLSLTGCIMIETNAPIGYEIKKTNTNVKMDVDTKTRTDKTTSVFDTMNDFMGGQKGSRVETSNTKSETEFTTTTKTKERGGHFRIGF